MGLVLYEYWLALDLTWRKIGGAAGMLNGGFRWKIVGSLQHGAVWGPAIPLNAFVHPKLARVYMRVFTCSSWRRSRAASSARDACPSSSKSRIFP